MDKYKEYTYSQSQKWITEVEDLRQSIITWGEREPRWETHHYEVALLCLKYPPVAQYMEVYYAIEEILDHPYFEPLIEWFAKKHLTKNQVLTSAGARIYFGDLTKHLQNYEHELLRDGYVRTEEEWWYEAEAKPALLHLLHPKTVVGKDKDKNEITFLEWWDTYNDIDIPSQIKKMVKRKIVEDLTAKLKPYSGKIQRTDEIGKYTISRETKYQYTSEIEHHLLVDQYGNNLASAFDFSHGYSKKQVRILISELSKLNEFEVRLLLTEHGQAAKNAHEKGGKADNTIKKLSQDSDIPESTLRQRKKRLINQIIENVTNETSKPVD